MYDEWILGRDAEGLAEEALGQLGVVGQPVLQADVQHGQVAPVVGVKGHRLSRADKGAIACVTLCHLSAGNSSYNAVSLIYYFPKDAQDCKCPEKPTPSSAGLQ